MSSNFSTNPSTNVSVTDIEAQLDSIALSATPTLNGCPDDEKKTTELDSKIINDDDHDQIQVLSPLRKKLVLAILSCAQFFDIFNACAVIIALPDLQEDLHFDEGTIQWVLAAYTLTFAAFMLMSGRISDMFHPKPVFVIGFLIIGVFSIPIGASVNPIMAIVLRAVQGIGAAMNIPSAIAMITTSFPDPVERGRAYAIYGAFGAIGNCLGFILGGVISSRASWRWDSCADENPIVFYLLAILVIPFSLASWFILPGTTSSEEKSQKKGLDWPGVASLTAGLILFVFAISEGSASGWNTARVIAPLVISVFTFGAFFLIERIVKDPALPPRTWTNKNFTPLFFYGWTPYWWVFASEMQLVEVFTSLWGMSTLSAAIRCLPLGIAGGTTAYLTGIFAPKVPRRVLLVSGQLFMAVGSILFALADDKEKYWSHIVPGMIIGMVGLGIAYTACTIVVMEGTRKGEEGVVSAVMYTSYQVGATLGLAVVASITLGVNSKLAQAEGTGSINEFTGYAASFWSLLGMNGLMVIITLLFVRN
ncbi:MFS general substrate transporter [Dendrothele bispora CBS 962.96]|uniref:MFS general substrate transporter n=1 Tax=Dendrothele bispora (strain CBS 962.96) TaxID=1314807 RepID=A0A4S8L0Y6_DENBC|nr:MFS general substrate transporter [Dendrothele bispora CBS 962.96]